MGGLRVGHRPGPGHRHARRGRRQAGAIPRGDDHPPQEPVVQDPLQRRPRRTLAAQRGAALGLGGLGLLLEGGQPDDARPPRLHLPGGPRRRVLVRRPDARHQGEALPGRGRGGRAEHEGDHRHEAADPGARARRPPRQHGGRPLGGAGRAPRPLDAGPRIPGRGGSRVAPGADPSPRPDRQGELGRGHRRAAQGPRHHRRQGRQQHRGVRDPPRRVGSRPGRASNDLAEFSAPPPITPVSPISSNSSFPPAEDLPPAAGAPTPRSPDAIEEAPESGPDAFHGRTPGARLRRRRTPGIPPR